MKKVFALTFSALLFAGAAVSSSHAQAAAEGAVDPGHPRVNEVDHRQRRQDARVAKGLQNGELTSRETSKIERRETNIQADKAADMRADGGHLTRAEKRNLNRRQNKVSREIKKDKHNDAVQ